MHLNDRELMLFAEAVIATFGSARAAAREYMEADINHGHVSLARQGNATPLLRKAWGIKKHPQRSRLIFSAPAAMVYEFHANAQARGMTPVKYQRHLLDSDAK